ncbi:BTAD domain-containing putative transcriptional regulator [Nonomuraea sp. MG754425]|uniref:AfsR/SARP family transcriptional regulator n=1 Tax=Nonomuraea sp. MG754425 TaxID=2570319 RepID=UPI001F33CA05|nr:BTAD domain-containing putative transcriptional regulator [Nonomuraea sp. MG754425]
MEFRLLGPIEVEAGGALVPLGGAKPQTLLAALLLEQGRIVPSSQLIDILWQDEPPDSARTTLQTYVRSLRTALARQGVVDAIVTRAPGYLIQTPNGSFDVENFSQLVTRARHTDTATEVSSLLRAALELWRGPALAGLEDGALAGEALRLEQLRLTAIEDRIAADLTLGRHSELLAELAALVSAYPANERLRGQYMTALYRTGRQSEALASFREGCDVLVEGFGVDPGPELTALYQAILHGDPALRGPSVAAPAEPPSRSVVPAQLPLAPSDFTGRARQVKTLVAALAPEPRAPVQVIAGRGGCGKSALAVHVAHQVTSAFPDGQLYAELGGMSDIPADAGEVLGRFLKALGVNPDSLPASAAERADLYRSLLAERRVLVLLDDAAGEQQVRPLLPGGPGCAVLVTARNRLGGLAGARRTDLDVLDADEALELLRHIVGADRVAAEWQDARAITELCGRLPLAVRIAGARLATRPGWPMSLLLQRLRDERRRLDELAISDLEVRSSVELSYRGLSARSRRALALLSYVGAPEFSSWILAWLLEITEAEAEAIIEGLVDAYLVDFTRVDELGCLRYRVHELIRLHGREHAEAEEPAEELTAAVGRVLGGWLTLIDAAAEQSPPEEIRWRRHPVRTYPVSEATVARVVAAPYTWFEVEQPALVSGVERAAGLGLHDLVCHFASARLSGPSFLGAGRFDARERINQLALASARRAGDRHGAATMLAELGQLRFMQDRFAEADQYLTAALEVFRDLDETHEQAVALAGLGTVSREVGRLAESLDFLDQAGRLLRDAGDDVGIAYVLRMIGSVQLERGDLPEAWSAMEAALAAYRRVGSRRGEGFTLRTISLHHRATGRLDLAAEAAGQAVAVFRELGDRLMEAYAVRTLAKTRVRQGRGSELLPRLREALALCQTMNDRWGRAATLRTLGELHLAAGDLDAAETCLTDAIVLWEDMKTPVWRARTERDLASVYRARGRPGAAEALLSRALAVFRDHGAREYGELAGR